MKRLVPASGIMTGTRTTELGKVLATTRTEGQWCFKGKVVTIPMIFVIGTKRSVEVPPTHLFHV